MKTRNILFVRERRQRGEGQVRKACIPPAVSPLIAGLIPVAYNVSKGFLLANDFLNAAECGSVS